jgi:L-asparaginase II
VIMDEMPANPVIAEVVRSGFTESRHRGSFIVWHGGSVQARGNVNVPFFPRSANKPLQATAMLRLGLPLKDELLALAAASHSGENFHVEGVRAILDQVGLTEADLRCPPALPSDAGAARALLASGGTETRIRMNCSGKHAAMLATCIVNGWPTPTYREPGHPLQVAIKATVEELCGEPVTRTGVDGCGAPLFALTLSGLARGFSQITNGDVAAAMRAHPEWVSGTTRDDRHMMDAVPGLMLKGGAEGAHAWVLPDGRAGAVKIDDGAHRAVVPVTAALLRGLGQTVPDELATVPVHGGDGIVGEVRAAF